MREPTAAEKLREAVKAEERGYRARATPKPPDRWTNPGRAVLLSTALLISAAFATNLVDHLIADSLCCADDAFFAVVAKNLATGHGYTTSYRVIPTKAWDTALFDSRITVGPGLIVPAAMAIRLLDNRYWVPGFVTVTFSILLLASIFGRVALATARPHGGSLIVILAILALNLATIGYYENWYALLGEIPALLALCLGAILTLDPRQRWRDYFLGGLLLGWSYQIKTLAALSVLPVLALLLIVVIQKGATVRAREGGQNNFARGLRILAVVAVASSAPTLAFETYKIRELGFEGYRHLKAEEINLLVSRGSGIDSLKSQGAVEHILHTTAHNWDVLKSYFRTDFGATAYLLTLAFGLAARGRWSGQDSMIPLAVMSMVTMNTGWWLLVADRGKIRHLLIGLGLWCLAVAFDLFWDRWSIRKLVLVLAFGAALLPRAEKVTWIVPRQPMFTPSSRTLAMLEAAQFLELHRKNHVIAADRSAGGVDMEYLLDGTANLVHHWYLQDIPASPILFLENAKWIDLDSRARARWDTVLTRYGAVCEFRKGPYRVYTAPQPDENGRTTSFRLRKLGREGSVIYGPEGTQYRVSNEALRGYIGRPLIQNSRLVLEGWAADVRRKERPVAILLFSGHKLLRVVSPKIPRPDVAQVFGAPALEVTGFRISIPLKAVKSSKETRLRIFALGRHGEATELRLPAIT